MHSLQYNSPLDADLNSDIAFTFDVRRALIIYVNDLPNATSCQLRLFADDTCLVLKNPTLNELETNYNLELLN